MVGFFAIQTLTAAALAGAPANPQPGTAPMAGELALHVHPADGGAGTASAYNAPVADLPELDATLATLEPVLTGVDVEAGSSFKIWLPAPIPDATFDTQPYMTAYADVRLQLFEVLSIQRLHYETSVGHNPDAVSEPSTDAGILRSAIANQRLDAILALFPQSWGPHEMSCVVRRANDPGCTLYMEQLGPAIRTDYQTYEGVLTLNSRKYLIDTDTNPNADFESLAVDGGTRIPFESRTLQVDVGLAFSNQDGMEQQSGLVGLSYLEFQKPWSLAYLSEQADDGDMVFYSGLRAWGVGQQLEKRTASGLMLDTSLFAGLGSIKIADGLYLEDIVGSASDNALSLAALTGGVTTGYDLGLEREKVHFSLALRVGGDFDYFFLYGGGEDADLLSEDNPILTFDLRAHGSVQARIGF